MSVSAGQVAEVRAQLRPVRTELEIAADVVCELFERRVLPFTPAMVRRVADVTGVAPDALRAATARRARLGYRPPSTAGHVAPAVVVPVEPRSGRPFRSEASARAYAEGAARGQRAGGATRSRQPASGADWMVCSKCATSKHVSHFNWRADRPKSRWTACNECRSAAQRARYLSVEKRAALNAARVTFRVDEIDAVLALSCMDCDRRLAVGDVVFGDASLHHVDCNRPTHGGC